MADASYKDRRFKESPIDQGADESIAYLLTVPTTWGTASFSSITCKLYSDPNGDNTDVSSTTLTGSASSSGQVITTKAVTGLTAGLKYRLDVVFDTSEGDTQMGFAIIYSQR